VVHKLSLNVCKNFSVGWQANEAIYYLTSAAGSRSTNFTRDKLFVVMLGDRRSTHRPTDRPPAANKAITAD